MATSQGVREMRARILHEALLIERPTTVDDIRHVPRVAMWKPEILDDAIADLAGAGLLEENAHGGLVIHEVVKR